MAIFNIFQGNRRDRLLGMQRRCC